MLTTVQNHIQVSNFRKNLSQYLKSSKEKPIFISTNRGNDVRVLLTAETYNKLIKTQQDQIDAKCLTDLVNEDTGERVEWKKIKKENHKAQTLI